MAIKLDDLGEALKKINAQLECSICLDTFKDPKLLQCFHVFCQLCLEPLVSRDGQSLHCPACRRSIPLGPNGVSGLQSDFHVQHLFEIRDTLEKVQTTKNTKCEKCDKQIATGYCRQCAQFICDRCKEVHTIWKELKTHELESLEKLRAEAQNLISSQKPIVKCAKHPNKSLKIYCESCSELICKDCTIRLHQGHNFDLITEVLPKHKEEIVSSMEPVRTKLETVEKGLQDIATVEMELKRHSEATEADIHKEIDQAHQALDQRRQELVEQLHQLTRQKLKTLATQKEEIETLQVQLSSCMAYFDGSMETGTDSEVLAMKAPIIKQVKELTTSFPSMTPAEGADSIHFVAGEQVQETCRKFGAVVDSVVCPEKCYIIEAQNIVAKEGEPTEVELHLVTQDGNECHHDCPDLTAELTQCKTKETSKCTIFKKDKTRAITFQPVRRGKHTLAVKVSGRDIQGSPFPVAVLPSPQNLAKPNTVIPGVNKPYGVTTNSKGHIIVAERGGHCISTFTAEGQKVLTFGQNGSGQGQFNGPIGVAVDNNDNIYAVDYNNNRIQKFTAGGQFIASVGSKGDQPLQFANPAGIGFNKMNKKLYICDQTNHRVQILNTDLTFHASFGSEGNENAQFENCLYAAFNSGGNVYVTDCSNNRVQVFTPEGEFLREIKATPKGSVPNPFAIAIDSSDNVYVSERDNHCVDIFNSRGEYIASFGSTGTKEGQFDGAFGLHIDRNDCVLVCDCKNGRIQVF